MNRMKAIVPNVMDEGGIANCVRPLAGSFVRAGRALRFRARRRRAAEGRITACLAACLHEHGGGVTLPANTRLQRLRVGIGCQEIPLCTRGASPPV
ncbi:MAG: hypothetical protein ACK4IC_04905 [Erythrobacter sp.]